MFCWARAAVRLARRLIIQSDSGDIFANVGDINGDDRVDITAVTANGLAVLLSGQTETASISNVAFYGCSTQSVTATYGGDGNYGTSTSSASTFTPAKDNTALALSVNPANGAVGQQVTLVATLAPYSYGTTTTNGETVTFYEQWREHRHRATLASGVATLVIHPRRYRQLPGNLCRGLHLQWQLQQLRDRYDLVSIRPLPGRRLRRLPMALR